jgi:hypothetical protein
MASETNELTFVRCPTCRSLVPASASKCRICNAILDAGSKGGASETPPPLGGRVRQKTVSAGAEEVRNMVTASAPPGTTQRQEPPSANSAPPPQALPASASSDTEDEMFDPLGAFLQDLDSADQGSVQASLLQESKNESLEKGRFDDDEGDDDDDDLDDFDLDILDDPLFSDTEDEENTSEMKEEDIEEELQDDDELNDESEEDAAVFEAPPEQAKPVVVAPPQESPQREAPRREAPQREAAQPPEARKPQNRDPQPPIARESRAVQAPPAVRGSQGPIRPRIGGMPHRQDVKPVPQKAAPQRTEQAPAAIRPVESRERVARTAPTSQQVVQQPMMQPVTAAGRGRPEASSQRAQAAPATQRANESSETVGARTGKMRAGRLVGWLVSYEHPDGRAIELRAGRFFVTGTSIRPTDLILEDQSISTPHALMAISENGLQLQDLMSERGTFIRLQGEAQYTREEGVVEVRHGDWIRFGDVEFLLTIVPA